MNIDRTFVARQSTTIHADITEVWDALVDPKMIKKYLLGTEAVSDWKVGSPMIFRGEWNGKKYEDKGKILALEPERKFQYTHWSSLSGLPDTPENYRTVTFELSAANKSTILSVMQSDCTEQECSISEKNWASVLTTLKDLLEK